MPYQPIDYSNLIGTPGFSETLLKNHFKLYEGYVTNVNKVVDILEKSETGTPAFSELKRRFGWEFNGMRLHELYFGNMTKTPKQVEPSGKLADQIKADFGSVDNWKKAFAAVCGMRGIGWAALIYDSVGKKLFNVWINEHDAGYPAGSVPILLGDVFEHAYMVDYGLAKPDYVQAFLKAIDWAEAGTRFGA